MSESRPRVQLTRGVPPVESFPIAQLAECAAAVLHEYGDVVLQYAPVRGFAPLRALLAREAGVDDDRVIVGQGSLQLQDFCARYLLGTGSVVYVEEPSYDRALTIIRRAGGQLVGFPLEEDGPDIDAVEARLESGERPKYFYVIPDFQNPSGAVLSLEKRQRLATLARAYEFWIVEDVPYRRLRYRGEEYPTLFELAPDRVIQMSSYSKLVSPGMRVGYVIAPASLAGPLAKMAEDTYIGPSYLNQAIIYEYIRRGWLEPNIARLCELYEPRLGATLSALEQHLADLATWQRPDGGFFVGVTLRFEVSADELLERARAANLILTDGRGFFPGCDVENFVRIPFCALTPEEINEGVVRLAEVLRGLVQAV
ncbi:MAG: PLP-dependent aminotransferase family protein [Chloroflexi bacterium]|nr:PLP-dependent aminotransferase family protein [Chloroflexota bacterium]